MYPGLQQVEQLKKKSFWLVGFRPRPEESLSLFMKRFNDKTLQAKKLNPDVALHALIVGMKVGYVLQFVGKNTL